MLLPATILALALSTQAQLSNDLIFSEKRANDKENVDSPSMMSEQDEETAKANAQALFTYLYEGQLDDFERAVKQIPNLETRTENGTYANVMARIISMDELRLAKWLNENCGDCNLKHSGYNVIDFMGRVVEGRPWQSMNADMFAYVYEQGGVSAYLEAIPGRSIFVTVADYWIPEAGGIYSDYITTDADDSNEKDRRQQKYDMLEFLIDKGHSVNEIDEVSNSFAMFNAVKAVDETMVDFLIANGAKADVGRNPLGAVTHRISPAFLEKLIDFGYNPNEVTAPYYSGLSTTLLGRIVGGGEFVPEILKVLEANDIDFNLPDSFDKQPIDYAYAEYNQEEQPFTEYLLSKGTKITDQYYYSTLVEAVQRGKIDVIRSVLSTHPQLANGLRSDEKTYPLERALWSKNIESFKLLIEAGAELKDSGNFAARLLVTAISRKQYDFAQTILEARPSTPVTIHVERDDTKYIVSQGLVDASSQGNLEWVNKLLGMGAVVETVHFRSHPIVGAALNGHSEVVKALLDAGSPIDLADDEGKTLIDRLEENGNKEMLSLIKSYEQ